MHTLLTYGVWMVPDGGSWGSGRAWVCLQQQPTSPTNYRQQVGNRRASVYVSSLQITEAFSLYTAMQRDYILAGQQASRADSKGGCRNLLVATIVATTEKAANGASCQNRHVCTRCIIWK